MKGSMRQRGAESWQLRVYVGRVNGRPQLVSRTFRGNKRQAQVELNKMLAAHQDQTLATAPGRLTVGDGMRAWLDEHMKARVGVRTWERYDELARLHVVPGLGAMPLPKLQPIAIQSFYGRLLREGRASKRKGGTATGLHPRTVLHIHRLVFSFLKHCVRMRLLAVNPATAVEPPKVARNEATALDVDQAEYLLQATVGTPLHVPVLLGLDCGLRRGEILALRWANVNLEAGTMMIADSLVETKAGLLFKGPKSSSGRRTVGLLASTTESLRLHRLRQAEQRLKVGPLWQDNDLVCAGEDGRPLSPRAVSKRFADLARRLKLPVRLHGTRHTAISHQLAAGVPLKDASTLAGHASVGITADLYGHVMPGHERSAVVRLEAYRATQRKERAANE